MFTPKFPWVRVYNLANVAINRNRNDIAKMCLDRKKHIHRVYFKIQVYVHSFIQQMQIGYQRGVRHMGEMVNKTGGVG